MTVAKYAALAAAVWMGQMAAAGLAFGSSTMPTARTAPPPPAPVGLTTGDSLALRWIAVGISGGLCVLLLTYAVLLAIRAHTPGPSVRTGTWMRHLRGNRSAG